jgi:ribonuclease HI
MLELFTDGAYSSSRDVGGWAYAITENDKLIDKDFYFVNKTTNIRMEIIAVIEAYKYLIENKITDPVKLYTDSMMVIGGMRSNWKLKKNLDLWEVLKDLDKKVKVEFVHVDGHSGNKYNELCDQMAVEASKNIMSYE